MPSRTPTKLSWREGFAVGQRVRVLARSGVIPGVIASATGHLAMLMLKEPDELSWNDIWVDTGLTKAELEETLGQILKKAFYDPSFTLIFLGFFSCGFQLAFVTAHFPAFVTEVCSAIHPESLLATIGITTTSALGAVAISLIGLANIGGTLLAGWAGKRYSKKYLLAGIYTGRTIVALAFIMTPMTPATVILFSIFMGALWLATVPLTSGLVAHLYGLRYMGTLYGIVFFSHQLGSFMGVWLGGRLYDIYGSYTAVWWVGIGVGAFSAIVHLPIKENRAPAAA